MYARDTSSGYRCGRCICNEEISKAGFRGAEGEVAYPDAMDGPRGVSGGAVGVGLCGRGFVQVGGVVGDGTVGEGGCGEFYGFSLFEAAEGFFGWRLG